MRAGLIALSVAAAFGLAAGFGGTAVYADKPTPRATPSTTTSSPAPTAARETRPPARPATPDEAPATTAAATVLWRLDDGGERVRELEARLAQLDRLSEQWVDASYGTATVKAVQGFQSSRALPVTGTVDEATWARLRSVTHRPTEAELHPARVDAAGPGVLDPRCLTGRVLCVDKTSRTLSWVVDGSVRRTLAVRFGSEYTPTREGVFHVYRKSADHVSNLYGSSMPYAMFFSGGQAVHYSSDFASRGYAGASHGCVNVRDLTALADLFADVQVGDAVVVHRS